jgi:hypothetical protein
VSRIRIGVEERRARLALRQHLAPAARGADVTTVARDLVALHATDPSTVYLAAWARLRSPAADDVSAALYERRELIRILGMRRTMFVVPVELMPVIQAACTRAIAVVERRRTVQFLAQAGLAEDPAAWLEEVEDATVAALARRGEALSVELSADEPRLAEQIRVAEGKSYAASQSVASRVLPLLAAHGRVVRGRPRGSWTSTQYRWSTVQAWLPAGVPELKAEEARVELARAWLRTFGPAPVADLKWWSGWTLGQTRAALAEIGPAEVDLDGEPAVALAGDLAPTPVPEPHAVLLPALDPSVMGWQARGWFLGAHKAALFDTNGNAGPTVWWAGRVVGGWAQRRDGEVVVRLLEDIGADATAAATAEAARLQEWIGPVRVIPRFRTPLERALTA